MHRRQELILVVCRRPSVASAIRCRGPVHPCDERRGVGCEKTINATMLCCFLAAVWVTMEMRQKLGMNESRNGWDCALRPACAVRTRRSRGVGCLRTACFPSNGQPRPTRRPGAWLRPPTTHTQFGLPQHIHYAPCHRSAAVPLPVYTSETSGTTRHWALALLGCRYTRSTCSSSIQQARL